MDDMESCDVPGASGSSTSEDTSPINAGALTRYTPIHELDDRYNTRIKPELLTFDSTGIGKKLTTVFPGGDSCDSLVVMVTNDSWKQFVSQNNPTRSTISESLISASERRRWEFSRADRKETLRHYLRPPSVWERRLRVAAATNNIEGVKNLLEQGVRPNNHDEQFRTPLHLASGRGYTEVVRLLLKHGANPSLKDCIGNTPLHLAAVTNKIAVVTLLLEAGVDPLSSDCHGYSPLQLAEGKLRLLQNCKGEDMLRIKSEVHEVVKMLTTWLKKNAEFGSQVDALSSICSRLTLTNSQHQVDNGVRDLLSSIDTLRVTNRT